MLAQSDTTEVSEEAPPLHCAPGPSSAARWLSLVNTRGRRAPLFLLLLLLAALPRAEKVSEYLLRNIAELVLVLAGEGSKRLLRDVSVVAVVVAMVVVMALVAVRCLVVAFVWQRVRRTHPNS